MSDFDYNPWMQGTEIGNPASIIRRPGTRTHNPARRAGPETVHVEGNRRKSAKTPERLRGKAVRLASRGAVVEGPGLARVRCEIRGAAKAGARRWKHPVAVGDDVLFAMTAKDEGVIEEVLPRRTTLIRRAPQRNYEQMLAANADAVLVIASTREPPFRPGLVDRVLVAAEAGGLQGWICLNKNDLDPPQDLEPVLEAYREASFRVFRASARTGEGLATLRSALQGKETVLIGHSGVGKSSLLGRLRPDLDLPVNPVSARTGRGVHTTTASERIPIDDETHVIDTPGIREFMPAGVTPDTLWKHYPELRGPGERCRFKDCLHRVEAGCEVLRAVEEGRIDRGRHERYVAILKTLLDKPKQLRRERGRRR